MNRHPVWEVPEDEWRRVAEERRSEVEAVVRVAKEDGGLDSPWFWPEQVWAYVFGEANLTWSGRPDFAFVRAVIERRSAK